jgi:hypothetical protein
MGNAGLCIAFCCAVLQVAGAKLYEAVDSVQLGEQLIGPSSEESIECGSKV